MKKRNLLLLFFVFACIINIDSQRPKIVQHIERNSKVRIKESTQIDNIINRYLNKEEEDEKKSRFGYRVQVFSSNKQKIAKEKSAEIEQEIRAQYPTIGVYRMFVSPFWKVRVGNFKSKRQAQEFRNQLVAKFPKLRKGTYVVRETRLTKN